MLKNQEGKIGAGNTGASSVSQLARRLLWNQIIAGNARPLPVVVLLGPAGAGKTWALNAISQEYGSSVVHALPYDFGMPESNIPEESATTTVLAALAADFSRSWPARPDARFYRFTLGWIAAHQQINGISRGQGKDQLRQSIEKLTQKSDAKISSAVTLLVASAVQAGLAPGPAPPPPNPVIPSPLRPPRRPPLPRPRP